MKKQISTFLRQLYFPSKKSATQKDYFWMGASIGVLILAFALALISSFHATFGISSSLIVIATIVLTIVIMVAFAVLSNLLIKSIKLYPIYYIAALGASIGLLVTLKNTLFRFPSNYFYYGGFFSLVAITLLAGGISTFIYGKWNEIKAGMKLAISAGMIIGFSYFIFIGVWLLSEGENSYPIEFEQTELPQKMRLNLVNPSKKGDFKVSNFTYGSGVNNKRSEYGEEVTYRSQTVDGTHILPQWKNKQAEKRSDYWGYGIKEWPLNGLVWIPEGDGPFPIVLIAHGNHNMEEYSDPGYAYLGELLASRGYIVVSIDENFINGSWAGDFRGKELPARAWLLLKHLEQWRAWNNDPTHELSGKADLEKIALIGHSRGGEAVPIAAAFNTLSHFPDDAREEFNFNFGIKAVIAIAPTDYRYDRRVRIENIDFLGIQGSYDSDEDSFFGLRQLQRTDYTDEKFHLKAGVYIHGANHGQFNSIWGRHDSGFPYNLLLNTEPMIPGEDQRQYAQVLIGAFLETSIKGNQQYAEVFQDLRHAEEWLPKEVLALNLYEDTNTKYWADFEEDIELTTTSLGQVSVSDFDIWAEDYLQYRAGRHQENHALVLGWTADSIPKKASYTITFDSLVSLSNEDLLTVSAGPGNPSLLEEEEEDSLVNDFNIILTDRLGKSSSVLLSDFKKIAPRLKIRFLKTKKLTTSRYDNEWEPFLETMYVPVSAFQSTDLELSSITSISIEANTRNAGIVLVDRIGLLTEK